MKTICCTFINHGKFYITKIQGKIFSNLASQRSKSHLLTHQNISSFLHNLFNYGIHFLLITASEVALVKIHKNFLLWDPFLILSYTQYCYLCISFHSNNPSFRAHLLPPLHETSTTRRETRKTTMMLPVRLLLLFLYARVLLNGDLVEFTRVIRRAERWWPSRAFLSFFSYTFSEKITKLLPPRFWRWRRASRRLLLVEYKVVDARKSVREAALGSVSTRWSEIWVNMYKNQNSGAWVVKSNKKKKKKKKILPPLTLWKSSSESDWSHCWVSKKVSSLLPVE